MNNTISENVGLCNRKDACGADSVPPLAVSPAPGAEGRIDFSLAVIFPYLRLGMGGPRRRRHICLWND